MFGKNKPVVFERYGRRRSRWRLPRWLLLLLAGIAIGAEGVAIEGDQASGTGRATEAGEAAAGNAGTSSLPAAAVVSAEPRAASVAAGQIAFAPDSAELPTDASAQLEEVLARAKSQGAVIRIDPETGRGLSIERLRVPLAG